MAYKRIKLEKAMYSQAKPFSGVLQELDPDENYKGTALEGLDAYQRQLKRFDIKVQGPAGDVVEKFFQTTDSAALFPEYVSRAVRQGMEAADLLPHIVASTTKVDGLDYRSITSLPSEDDKELKVVGEGAQIPQTRVKSQENLVRLHKRGRMLVASYEAIRFQRLDLFTVTLKQIGAYIARAQLKDAVDVLINGDGNQNAAPILEAEEEGQLSYGDLVAFWNLFDPYELNALIAGPDLMQKLLTLNEFKDSLAGFDFHRTGKPGTPIGAKLMKSAAVGSGKLVGLDKNCALEMVKAGDIVTEYDKLIDRQLDRATISCITGFTKIFKDSARVLTV